MSEPNASQIASLLAQSINTIQQQVLTNSNILTATQNVVDSNTTAITVNSSSINTSSTQISNLQTQITENTNDIDSLTQQEAQDFQLATSRLNTLDISMNTIFLKEETDVTNLQTQVDAHQSDITSILAKNVVQDVSLNLVQTQTDLNTQDILGLKNWDGSFVTEFQNVYAKINDIIADVSDNLILDASQNILIAELQSTDVSLQNQITTNSNDILAMKNTDMNFDSHFTQVNARIDDVITDLSGVILEKVQEVTQLTSRLNVTDASLNTLTTEYNLTSSIVSDHSSAIYDLQQDDVVKSSQITSLQSQITNVDDRLTNTRNEYDNEFNVKGNQISILQNSVQNINDVQIPSIQNNVSSNSTNIVVLQNGLASTQSTLSNVSSITNTNTSDITAVQGELQIIQNGISQNSTNLNSISSSVNTLSSNISGLQNQILTVQNQPGPKGDKGDPGDMGPRGYVGPQGDRGEQGPQGFKGDLGDIGPMGPAGATGPQGLQGLQGLAGSNGTNGATGPTGPQGLQGLQGLAGSNGTNGATGPTGPQGLQGLQGLAGSNGTNGATGPTGPQGLQGLQGLAGSNGTNGATGPTGPQGLQGSAGPTGPSGALQIGVANTWTALQTFSGGISTSSETVSGNSTLGTNSTNTLTVNSTATFNQPPIMSGASITANTIPASCIVGGGGGASLSSANTWTAKQTFNAGIGLPTTGYSLPSANSIGYQVTQSINVTNYTQGTTVNLSTLSLTAGVWIVSFYLDVKSNNGATPVWALIQLNAMQGTSWSANNQANNVIVCGFYNNAGGIYTPTNDGIFTSCGVYSSASASSVSFGGILYTPTSTPTFTLYGSFTATRIA